MEARDKGFERATVSDWLARAQRIRNRETSAAAEPLDADDATLRQMFLAMFEHSVDGITLNARGTRVLLEVSDSFCEMSGYERDELLGRTSTELELTDPEGISALATTRADSGEPAPLPGGGGAAAAYVPATSSAASAVTSSPSSSRDRGWTPRRSSRHGSSARSRRSSRPPTDRRGSR